MIGLKKQVEVPNLVQLNHWRGTSGFSLIELVVGMVVFLLITGAIFGAMQFAQQSRKVTNQQVQLNRAIRVALNLLGRDTYNAGFGYPLGNTVVLPDGRITALLGLPDDFDNSRDTVPPIIAGNEVNPNVFSQIPGTKTDQVTFLFKDTEFNLTGPSGSEISLPLGINAATTTDGIDEIVPIDGDNSVCKIGDLYLINGNTGSVLGLATGLSGTNIVQFGNGDMLGINQTGPTGPLRGITTPASMLRVKMVTYFVTPDGILTRRVYANRPPPATEPWVDEPIVYGIEGFQIEYIMDDGSISDNPSAGPNGIAGDADDEQANLAAVRQVRFTVSARTSDANVTGRPFRVSLSSTFGTRNMGYEAN